MSKIEERKIIDAIIAARKNQIKIIEEEIIDRLRNDIIVARKVKSGEYPVERLARTAKRTSELMKSIFTEDTRRRYNESR